MRLNSPEIAFICLLIAALTFGLYKRRTRTSTIAHVESLRDAALSRGDSLMWRHPSVTEGD